MKRPWLWLLLVPLCCVAIVAHAEEDGGEEYGEHEERVEEAETEILGQNVRLQFSMVPAEEDNAGLFVVTGGAWFEMTSFFQGVDGSMEYGVSGRAHWLEDGRLFVRFEARLSMQGEKEEGNFHCESGVVLVPGRELAVSRFGDKTLVVRADLIDAE